MTQRVVKMKETSSYPVSGKNFTVKHSPNIYKSPKFFSDMMDDATWFNFLHLEVIQIL